MAVIERTDEPAAADNPLTREVKAALFDAAVTARRSREYGPCLPGSDRATSGRATWLLSSTGLTAADPASADPRYAVVGIRHPLGLERVPLDLRPEGSFSLRGHSIGGFGSVTTNKLVASLVGDLFGLQVQAYPRYGSEKKGLPTTYYLTVADERDPPAR